MWLSWRLHDRQRHCLCIFERTLNLFKQLYITLWRNWLYKFSWYRVWMFKTNFQFNFSHFMISANILWCSSTCLPLPILGLDFLHFVRLVTQFSIFFISAASLICNCKWERAARISEILKLFIFKHPYNVEIICKKMPVMVFFWWNTIFEKKCLILKLFILKV